MVGSSAWSKHLSSLAPLSFEDKSHIKMLIAGARACAVDDGFAESKDAADHVLVVLDGVACRFQMLADGRRQILAFLFPGDMTSPRRLLVRNPGQSLSLLVPSQIVALDRAAIDQLFRRPNLCMALGRDCHVRQATAAEWQVNVGVRTASERVSHLLCEMFARLSAVSLATEQSFRLPLTQLQLAESLALSAVHVNRTLMSLRRQGFLEIRDRVVTIHDYDGLCDMAGFDPAYLQLSEAGWVPEPAHAERPQTPAH